MNDVSCMYVIKLIYVRVLDILGLYIHFIEYVAFVFNKRK